MHQELAKTEEEMAQEQDIQFLQKQELEGLKIHIQEFNQEN
jgi:hypothetical protein